VALAKDEFLDNDNWPRQLYIREARRMVSEYVMSEKNCKRNEVVPDSVGMGAYNMDSHNTQRYVTSEGFARNEGDIQYPTRPYPISYRSIRPREEECSNLLVPVCLAASHIAYGSIRMEPVFMVLGQSAATAAVMAIDENTMVQKINYDQLKAKLVEDRQVLDFVSDPLPENLSVSKSSLAGLVVDDEDADRTGFSLHSQSVPPFIGTGYVHDGHTEKGKQRVRFTPKLPQKGTYQVFLTYPAAGNRASNVPVTVHHIDGDTRVQINQRNKAPLEGFRLSLGKFDFERGEAGYVEVSNEGTDGHVVVDAVQWVLVTP
jgi:hypothetical protein